MHQLGSLLGYGLCYLRVSMPQTAHSNPGEEVEILGLDFSDSQPDKAVVEYLKAMGADITIDSGSVVVRSARLRGVGGRQIDRAAGA